MSGDLANVVRICTIGIGRNGKIRIGRGDQKNVTVLLKIIHIMAQWQIWSEYQSCQQTKIEGDSNRAVWSV